MLKPIVFWGASGHARVLREFIEVLGYQLVALFDNAPETPPPFPDVPLFYGQEGFRRWQDGSKWKDVAGLVAIGGQRGEDRLELQRFLQTHGIRPIVAIHPRAFVAANARVGEGSQVLAQAAVCTEVQVGPASIINTSASVDHESILGRGIHIAPGATIAGCVEVGDFTMVGSGAVVLPRIRIGRNVLVGAGAVVTKDIPENTVALGNPARVVRDNLTQHTDAKL
jgi:sugar O-acyltransferase (sialic acid O-acetyltransferase NeuD family)